MTVRVVVDSSAGLPAEVVRELDITVADMHVVGAGEEKGTSGLSSLELAACYARQLERGGDDGVVALHLSKALSSTWSAAVAASAIFPGTVRVVETDAAGMSVGAAAMAAATVALEGGDLAACEAMAKSTLARAETWIYLHQLDDLRKSGRLPTGTAVLSAALLANKPILRMHDGKLELAGKTRTQSKAFAKLTELVVERAAREPVFAAIQHADAAEAAGQLGAMLEEGLPPGSRVMLEPLVDVLAVHTGPGAIGLSVVFSSQEPTQ
ncbi:DegV family protein with EDD domain [Corynebacterium mucifaciens]|uniref:DegV family protein n=1 Tax=Corynebacterium ureicelerivorans TaxID=401472 RepID=UPI0023571145|nr:DegV family protein [Corynebacterium ureicelerivorans]MDN8626505.1 DegV family protein [Corynebacterium ureicelerivorans]